MKYPHHIPMIFPIISAWSNPHCCSSYLTKPRPRSSCRFFSFFPAFAVSRSGVFASGAASLKVFEETWELQTVEYIDINILNSLENYMELY